MNTLEIVCLCVVFLWCALRFRVTPSGARGALLLQMLVIATAAWLAEDSSIRLYGFYFYSETSWTLFIDRVPLLILLIWPVVVTSALDLSRALRVPAARLPLLLFVLVVVDAWFIEPIAVDSGLWTWTQTGPFHVPTIGVLGWGCFACGVGLVVARGAPIALAVVAGPLVCHALLLALWWGAFRWLPDPPHPFLHPAAAWIVALCVVFAVVTRRPVGLRQLVWLRVPAALFFFALLALHGRDDDDAPLLVWSLAFAPPWLSLWLLSPPALTSSAADDDRAVVSQESA